MKPFFYAALIALVMFACAYRATKSAQAALLEKRAAFADLEAQLSAARAVTEATRASGRVAAALSPKLNDYIDVWMRTVPMYTRISEQTQDLLHTWGCQTIDNSLQEENRKVRFAGHEYNVALRYYSHTGAYANAVNYYAAFETKFELMSVQTLDVTRKGDQVRFAVTMLLPLFEGTAN